MFNVMELRLIHYSINNTMENLKKRLAILNPESDDVIEASNDLMMLQEILDKIKANKEV